MNKLYASAVTELSLRLLRLTDGSPSRMVSALSLSEALALLAEGAAGETLAELERALGMPLDKLRKALPAFLAALPSGEYAAFRSANSAWAEADGFRLNQDYAARLREIYDAEIHAISFNTPGAAETINRWVSDHTDGMIDNMVDDGDIRDLSLMLINALCFEAIWQRPFDPHTSRRIFTCANGTTVETDFMTSESDRLLIDCNGTTGFIKPYADGSYSFAALLPPEGVSLEDYLAEMNGENFTALVDSAVVCDNLRIRMPRFKLDYSVLLNQALRSLGVTRIFDRENAELAELGRASGRLYVDSVLQKTHIDVDTEGTRAAAVTSIMVRAMSLCPSPTYREIELNRPFLYAIIENATGTPLFIGVLSDIG